MFSVSYLVATLLLLITATGQALTRKLQRDYYYTLYRHGRKILLERRSLT